VSKMNIWMKPAAQIESRTESQTIAWLFLSHVTLTLSSMANILWQFDA
jgi:hypothetical protein